MKHDFTNLTDVELRERIAEKEALVFLALRVGGVGMWDWHFNPISPFDGGEVVWDEQMHELFGTAPETWGGTFRAFEELLIPEDRSAVTNAVKESLDHNLPYDYSFTLMNGRKIRGKGQVFYNEKDEPIRMLGVCIDNSHAVCTRKDSKHRVEN